MAGLARLSLGDAISGDQVLVLGAHCDDGEIGCGATLVDLAERSPDLRFHAITFCSDPEREKECRRALSTLLGEKANLTMDFGGLRDGFLPYRAEEAKQFLIDKTRGLSPSLIFTHSHNDLHQDHRFVFEITRQVLRDGLVLEMEIPKYDGDLGRPNVYCPVSRSAVERKISTLMTCYPSQLKKQWFADETFEALLRLRGLECKADTGMAEAFYASKIIMS
ncbi:MAG: PIG-L family deacetylase [Pseudomonadales bacterium]